MAKEKNILDKLDDLKNNQQFEVPKGYFENLTDRVMDKVKEGEVESRKPEKKTVFTLLRNQMAIAASFAALFLLAYTAIKIIVPDYSENKLPENEILATLEMEVFDIDEELLYNITMNESSEETMNNELSDQEIIDYLLDEGTELDLSTYDF